MFHPSHSSYVKALYKKILSEGSLLFDDRSRHYVKNYTRNAFRNYKECKDLVRVKHKIKEARKKLHRIEDANRGNQKSTLKILEEVYGRNGKTRHSLLHPFLSCHQQVDIDKPVPFVAHVPRTAPPPVLCLPLVDLITQDLKKKIEPDLPEPVYKPLHPGRKANLLWKYRSTLLDRVQVPLPFEIVCELELKAGASTDHPLYAGNLLKGGPKWDEFYVKQENMQHLNPTMEMPTRSTLHRRAKLMDSPYVMKSIEKSLFNKEEEKKDLYEYPRRAQRRLYKRLLFSVPFTNIITPTSLWKADKSHKITKSYWIPQRITQLLQDIPSEQVIENTLGKSKGKGKKKQ